MLLIILIPDLAWYDDANMLNRAVKNVEWTPSGPDDAIHWPPCEADYMDESIKICLWGDVIADVTQFR